MSFTKRLQKEYIEMSKSAISEYCKFEIDSNNILSWTAMLQPASQPFDKFSFKIHIQFPSEYPFKPPKIAFLTPIYHPNVDEKGQICLPIISSENWKPSIKTEQVVQSLLALVNDPDPDNGVNSQVSKEFMTDKAKFLKNAEEHCKKHATPV